jgi:hypothetical protein
MTRSSLKLTARERAAGLAAQVREAKLDERAAELAERVRESATLAKAQAKSQELTALAAEKLRDAQLDERAAEFAARIRTSEAGQQVSETAQQVGESAKRLTDRTLENLGTKLSHGRAGELLGVEPAKRRFPWWLAALLGAGVGYLISVFAAGKRDEQVRDELLATADRMAAESAAAGPVAAPTPTPLTDIIRAQLGRDERTSALTGLDINVAEGTVFVRGTVPAGFDQATIRDVIAEVPGVHDVDLQVTPSNSNV